MTGVFEILGSLSLLLLGLFGTATFLVPLAALGLAVIMLLSVIFHISRGEMFTFNSR